MAIMICRECQQKIAEDDINSVDGWLYCSSCLSKMGTANRATKLEISSDSVWTVSEIKTQRIIYLIVFLLMIAGNILGGLFLTINYVFVIHLIIGIVFLMMFINVTRQVLGYSVGNLVGIAIILFIPYLSLITIAFIDHKIYKVIKERQSPSAKS